MLVDSLFIHLGGACCLRRTSHQHRGAQRRTRNLEGVSAQTTLLALSTDVGMMRDITPEHHANRRVGCVLVRIQIRHCLVFLTTIFHPARGLLLHSI